MRAADAYIAAARLAKLGCFVVAKYLEPAVSAHGPESVDQLQNTYWTEFIGEATKSRGVHEKQARPHSQNHLNQITNPLLRFTQNFAYRWLVSSEETFMDYVDSQSQRIGRQANRTSPAPWTAKLKSRDFLEVSITYGMVLLALWTPKPAQGWLFWITLAWVVSAIIASGQDARTLGFRPSELRRSIWIAGFAVLTAVIAVWIAAQMHVLHPFLPRVSAAPRFLAYLLWALLQQFLLQDFFLLRLLRLLPTKTAAVIVATVLFASAHIPNLLLVVATLLWGAAGCALFLRYRDLYSLGIAHGILGICLAITLPNAIQHQMRVGLGYLHYHEPPHRSQINHIVSTDAWVIADAIRRCPSLQALP